MHTVFLHKTFSAYLNLPLCPILWKKRLDKSMKERRSFREDAYLFVCNEFFPGKRRAYRVIRRKLPNRAAASSRTAGARLLSRSYGHFRQRQLSLDGQRV